MSNLLSTPQEAQGDMCFWTIPELGTPQFLQPWGTEIQQDPVRPLSVNSAALVEPNMCNTKDFSPTKLAFFNTFFHELQSNTSDLTEKI